MSKEITGGKKGAVARLYFEGLSYDEIARKAGVAKGSVAAIIDELKEGRFPQFEQLTEHLNEIRELVVALRKAETSKTEAVYLFPMVKKLIALGVEPSHMEAWISMSRSVPTEGFAQSQILQAAIRLARMESEGTSYEEAIEAVKQSLAEEKRLEEKVSSLRAEQAELEEKGKSLHEGSRSLQQEIKRLTAERERAEKTLQELLTRCRELEQNIEQEEAGLASLQKKQTELAEELPQLETKAESLRSQLADEGEEISKLRNIGFAGDELAKLNTTLTELARRHGKEDVAVRFFGYLDSYDSLLEMERARSRLTSEIEDLTQLRDSLDQITKKWGMDTDEIIHGIAALKAISRRGVTPAAIVSYQRALVEAGSDPQSFEKLVKQFGGIEQALTARQNQLKSLQETLQAKTKALEELKKEETAVKQSITTLRDSAVELIDTTANSATSQVEKLCRELRENITRWGDLKAEIGQYEQEIKLARYFAKLPLSAEALSSLIEDIDVPVVMQYLAIALTWCQRKPNPKLKAPEAIRRKYYGIPEYADFELADIVHWALLALTEGASNVQRRV